MKKQGENARSEVNMAQGIWGPLPESSRKALAQLVQKYSLSVGWGDLLYLENRWYVTHSGLLRLSRRQRCSGIHVRPVPAFCNPSATRWAFKATVYRSSKCRGFVGYGDADPSNVSQLVHGAEMRVAETRAVNRALRKAYGIGICSVEEIGSFPAVKPSTGESRKSHRNLPTGRLRRSHSPRSSLPTNSSAPARSRVWSSRTQPISVVSRPCAKPRASRSRISSLTWPTGPRKTAMP